MERQQALNMAKSYNFYQDRWFVDEDFSEDDVADAIQAGARTTAEVKRYLLHKEF